MIKALEKLVIKGKYLKIANTIHDKPIANIVLNRKRLKLFLLRSDKGVHSPHYSVRLLNQSNNARERNKRDTNMKGRSQIISICR
jgi:hypothetical protein